MLVVTDVPQAGLPAGTAADAARIPIAQATAAAAAAAKTTTRSLGEIILVVVPCRSSADRSILSVARIPLDLTSLRSCPASRRIASRRGWCTHADIPSSGTRSDRRQDRDETPRRLRAIFFFFFFYRIAARASRVLRKGERGRSKRIASTRRFEGTDQASISISMNPSVNLEDFGR